LSIADGRVIEIADLVRGRDPMTVAAFMDLALYHPEIGYYARAARRSGRAGDFFTSVDAGPLFGELLEQQVFEMRALLDGPNSERGFDIVEAGAGHGRLSDDILRAARARSAFFYQSIRLHLVEASPAARRAQRTTLGDHAGRLVWSKAALPDEFEGVVIANELVDALPVHQVVMRDEGLREVYVAEASRRAGTTLGATSGVTHAGIDLTLVEGPPSTPELGEYLARLGVELQPGWRAEINLQGLEWIREVARRLRRGFVIVIDYGHEAGDLYSASHSSGTLTTYRRHSSTGPEAPGAPDWLRFPGDCDITSHVDFTSLRAAAEAEGLQTLGFMDQTYFLLGLLKASGDFQLLTSDQSIGNQQSRISNLKTLILPGGLGSTHKVMIFAKGVGTPALRGCSYRMRVT
jgi:SAM-dependent MidA family methyltransferase